MSHEVATAGSPMREHGVRRRERSRATKWRQQWRAAERLAEVFASVSGPGSLIFHLLYVRFHLSFSRGVLSGVVATKEYVSIVARCAMFQLHFLAGIFAIIGMFLLYQAIAYFRRSSVRTKVHGEIIQMNTTYSYGGPNREHTYHYEFEVGYTFHGQRYRVSIGTGSGVFPHYRIGSRVTLLVDENRPENAEFFTKQEIALRVGLALAGLVFVGMAFVVWLGMYGWIEFNSKLGEDVVSALGGAWMRNGHTDC